MTFTYRGESFEYFDHEYNTTALNERSIEVPIARRFVAQQGKRKGLEVGNVLSHYGPVQHRVIDLYETGVENVDVFDLTGKWSWILAVSTLEHVGVWPGEPDRPERAVDAAIHLVGSLRKGGRMLATVPFDQNDALDEAILDHGLDADVSTTLLWSPDGWTEVDGAVWGPRREPHIWPSALWIGEWQR